MAPYRHRQQRTGHRFRYGPVHLVRHQRGTRHQHDIPAPKALRRKRRLRLVPLALGVVLLVLLVLGAMAYRSLVDARNSLEAARGVITQALNDRHQLLSAGGRARAGAEIAEVEAAAGEAEHTLHDSAGLSVLGALPVLDTQRRGVESLTGDVHDVAATSRTLLGEVDALVAQSSGTTVSLADLRRLEAQLTVSQKSLSGADRPAAGLWGSLARARSQFDAQDRRLVTYLAQGRRAVGYALPFLGAQGPRTYLVAGENSAEMRDQGAVLSLAVLHASGGTFGIDTTGSVDNIELSSPADVAIPPGTQKVFGGYFPTQTWQSTNASADFPFSGRAMQAMYLAAAQQHVDGVIGIDVPALSGLLQLTGPVTVSGIAGPITAANVDYQLLDRIYQGVPQGGGETERHDEISAVAKAAFDKMKTEHVDLAALADTLAAAVAGRHLLIWDDVPAYEATVASFGASGALDTVDPTRTFHLAVESATAAKLDYFMDERVRMTITVNRAGTASVNTYVTLLNRAPAGLPPSAQFGPDNVNTFIPGQYLSNVYLWSPRGSLTAGGVAESGLVVDESSTSVLAQGERTVSFGTVIPHAVTGGHLRLHLIPQSRLVPAQLSVRLSAAGWNVGGPATVAVAWRRVVDLGWNLTPATGTEAQAK